MEAPECLPLRVYEINITIKTTLICKCIPDQSREYYCHYLKMGFRFFPPPEELYSPRLRFPYFEPVPHDQSVFREESRRGNSCDCGEKFEGLRVRRGTWKTER